MSEKGMIFTAESVQAILSGVKTQTRRVITPQPTASECFGICTESIDKNNVGKVGFGEKQEVMQYVKLPCQIGDIIYVQETFTWNDNLKCYGYKASCPIEFLDPSKWVRSPWKSPRYMPKAAARIFLRVTDLRVERLLQISEDDAKAEGMTRTGKEMLDGVLYEEKYVEHWNEINGKREKGAYKWENNPFVWVYTFERVENYV